jgi:hypothetical protein
VFFSHWISSRVPVFFSHPIIGAVLFVRCLPVCKYRCFPVNMQVLRVFSLYLLGKNGFNHRFFRTEPT